MNRIKTLAIVDDDRLFVMLTKKVIGQTGLVDNIQVYESGEEVLDYYNSTLEPGVEFPEVMFLDLSMPIMDGWQFLERYQKIPAERKKTKIFIASSSISPDDISRAKAIDEVTDFIIKPITAEKINEVMRKI